MDDPILPTLELLEWRIRRLQFVLHGNSSSEDTELPQGQSAVTRLSKLENGLHHLTHQYQAIYEILKLRTFPFLPHHDRNIAHSSSQTQSILLYLMMPLQLP